VLSAWLRMSLLPSAFWLFHLQILMRRLKEVLQSIRYFEYTWIDFV
jgi:hypothetical protein